MGTCLAVIKVIGISSLGLFTGGVVTNVLNSTDIFKYVINISTSTNIKQINKTIISKIIENGIYLSTFGILSTISFQLAYFGSPLKLKHPYLIYSSLIFPISSLIFGLITNKEFYKYIYLDWFLLKSKPEPKPKKEPIQSELDNSVYKDLGDNSSVDEHGDEEDEELEAEVDFHLSKKVAIEAIERVNLANKVVSVISFIGLVITSVGVHGDF